MRLLLEPYSGVYADAVHHMLQADLCSSPLFARLLTDLSEDAKVICADEKPVGFLLSEPGSSVLWLWVFISPEMRGRGLASAALKQFAGTVPANIRKISSFYNLEDASAAAFAAKHGFARSFDSAYMEYSGGPFPEVSLPVRRYTDADYPESQKMYAEAFHNMRVQVGDFPDSVVYPPSEENRMRWLADADNYFLYTEQGAVVGVGHLNGGEIGSVSVRLDKQGQGIGSRFVPYLINRILERGYEKVSLECVVGNPAGRLYDRLGFQALYTERFVEKKVGETI